MEPYIYILKEINTNRKYVGVQYNKKANPSDLMTRYFTSNKIIKANPSNFIITRIKISKKARDLERRYLRYLYYKLGKSIFLDLYLNRNLAPGIIHDSSECARISERMKLLWATTDRREKHKQDLEKRIHSGFYESRKGVDPFNEETKLFFSERMKKHNPMFNEEVRTKHKEKMNSQEIKEIRSKNSKGNTYAKGRVWYNNGKVSKMFKETPNPNEGWVKGRLNPHWNYNRKKDE